MNNFLLKNILIKEKEENLTQDVGQLKVYIKTYKGTTDEIKKLYETIQDTLDNIKQMESENRKRFQLVEKSMLRFKISEIKIDKWVAKIENQLKFKVIRSDFKILWETAFSKVNKQTQAILKDIEDTQHELKKKETVNVLTIGEGIGDKIRHLWNSVVSFVKNIKELDKLANSLPRVT